MNPRGRGRPLRFVAIVVAGWTGLRIAMLWPAAHPALSAAPRIASVASTPPLMAPLPAPAATRAAPHRLLRQWQRPFLRPVAPALLPEAPARVKTQPASLTPPPFALARARLGAGQDRFAVPIWTRPAQARRWLASSWLVLRPGQGIGSAPTASQLGGSQYGLRLRYGLGSGRHLAVYGRVAGPLQGRGAEAALGLEWQPGAAPVRVAIEQRAGLDGMPGGQGLGIVTGIDPRNLAGFRLEAYGQAGLVVRRRSDPYADGALRITLPLATGRRAAVTIGAGLWGAAQREAQRLDIGPTLVATLPIGKAGARLALDWRQRVAGQARPGSGVALTLGSDF